MGRRRGFAAFAAVLVLGFGVVACGSDDEDGGGGSSGSASAGATDTAGKEALAKAEAAVAESSKKPTDIGTDTKLEKSAKGKRVAWVACTTNICSTGTKYFKEAAAELGLDVTVISVGPTPDAMQKAMNSVVSGNFDVVSIGLIPAVVVGKQLAQLKKDGVPVIAGGNQAQPNDAIVGATLGAETLDRVGTLAANSVAADSKGKGKVVYLTTPEFPGLKPTVDGFSRTLKENCPGCSMDLLNVKTTDIGTGIPRQVVSYLQKHPDVSYVDCQFGDLFTGLPQALKTAGLDKQVKLIDQASSPVNFEYTKQNQQYATVGSFLDVLSWQSADAMAKVATGMPFEEPGYPIQLLYPKDITFDTNAQPPFGDPDWKEKFKALWADAA
jgi:ribose transport system substrate-binding protein